MDADLLNSAGFPVEKKGEETRSYSPVTLCLRLGSVIQGTSNLFGFWKSSRIGAAECSNMNIPYTNWMEASSAATDGARGYCLQLDKLTTF